MQRVIRGSVGHPYACALGKANFFRKGMHLFFEREDVLGVGSRYGFRGVDTVPRLHFFDAIANRFDYSRGIRAWRVGKRGLYGVSARAHVGVVGIHTGCMDTDKDLTGGRLGRGDLFEL